MEKPAENAQEAWGGWQGWSGGDDDSWWQGKWDENADAEAQKGTWDETADAKGKKPADQPQCPDTSAADATQDTTTAPSGVAAAQWLDSPAAPATQWLGSSEPVSTRDNGATDEPNRSNSPPVPTPVQEWLAASAAPAAISSPDEVPTAATEATEGTVQNHVSAPVPEQQATEGTVQNHVSAPAPEQQANDQAPENHDSTPAPQQQATDATVQNHASSPAPEQQVEVPVAVPEADVPIPAIVSHEPEAEIPLGALAQQAIAEATNPQADIPMPTLIAPEVVNSVNETVAAEAVPIETNSLHGLAPVDEDSTVEAAPPVDEVPTAEAPSSQPEDHVVEKQIEEPVEAEPCKWEVALQAGQVELTERERQVLTGDPNLQVNFVNVTSFQTQISEMLGVKIRVESSVLTSDARWEKVLKYVRLVCTADQGWIKLKEPDIEDDLSFLELPAGMSVEVFIGRRGENLMKMGFSAGALCFADQGTCESMAAAPAPFWIRPGRQVQFRSSCDIRDKALDVGTVTQVTRNGTVLVRMECGDERSVDLTKLHPVFEKGEALEYKSEHKWEKGVVQGFDTSTDMVKISKATDLPVFVEAEEAEAHVPLDAIREASVCEEKPAGRIAILGEYRARGSAYLNFVSFVEKRKAGFVQDLFARGGSWGAGPGDDWSAIKFEVPEGMLGRCIGKKGVMRKKLCGVTETAIEFCENTAVIAGPKESRDCAHALMTTLCSSEKGDVQSNVEAEAWCEQVRVPEDCVKSVLSRAALNKVEEECGVFIFFVAEEEQKWSDEDWNNWQKQAEDTPENAAADAPTETPAEETDAPATTEAAEKENSTEVVSTDAPVEEKSEETSQEVCEAETVKEAMEEPTQTTDATKIEETPAATPAVAERKLIVLSLPRRPRFVASLRIKSIVEAWQAGFYNMDTVEFTDKCGNGVETSDIPEDLLEKAQGWSDCNRETIQNASGAGVVYIGHKAVFVGSPVERERASRYLQYLLESEASGDVWALRRSAEILESNDVTVMRLSGDDLKQLSKDQTPLHEAQQAGRSFALLRIPPPEEIFAQGETVYVQKSGFAYAARIVKAESTDVGLELGINVDCTTGPSTDEASNKEDAELMFFSGSPKSSGTSASERLRKALDAITGETEGGSEAEPKNADNAWGNWKAGDNSNNEKPAGGGWGGGAKAGNYGTDNAGGGRKQNWNNAKTKNDEWGGGGWNDTNDNAAGWKGSDSGNQWGQNKKGGDAWKESKTEKDAGGGWKGDGGGSNWEWGDDEGWGCAGGAGSSGGGRGKGGFERPRSDRPREDMYSERDRYGGCRYADPRDVPRCDPRDPRGDPRYDPRDPRGDPRSDPRDRYAGCGACMDRYAHASRYSSGASPFGTPDPRSWNSCGPPFGGGGYALAGHPDMRRPPPSCGPPGGKGYGCMQMPPGGLQGSGPWTGGLPPVPEKGQWENWKGGRG